jgi:hypothetical protein
MAVVIRFGLIQPNTKESGETTKPVEKADFGMPMAIITMDPGSMTKRVVMVYMFTKMEQNIRVIGRTIYSMVSESKYGIFYYNYFSKGQTAPSMKDTI